MATAQHAAPTGAARALPAHLARNARLLRHTPYGVLLANVPNVTAHVTRDAVVKGLADGSIKPWQAAQLWISAAQYGQP